MMKETKQKVIKGVEEEEKEEEEEEYKIKKMWNELRNNLSGRIHP